jgi:hypothetical protein
MNIDQIDQLTEAELLAIPLCEFNFDLRSSHLMRSINDLKFELNQKKINFIPKIWVSTDWFSPDGEAGFALPFYLFHPRLIKLQKKFVGRVEGHTEKTLIKFLRHETAHALDNAFGLRKKKKRQILFGLSTTPYPLNYTPNPNSKDFVRHLDEFYAQSHPDEDWAETFSVWIAPKSKWQQKYQDWSAKTKLDYLDSVFQTMTYSNRKKKTVKEIDCVSKDMRTLREFFKEKRDEVNPYKKPIRQKNKHIIASFIIQNPAESKRAIQKITKNSFTTHKVLKIISKEFSKEFAKESQIVQSDSTYSREAAEKDLLSLTKKMIKSGRHKVIM